MIIITTITYISNRVQPIKWKDKAFERAIQLALNKEGENIYSKQLENITELHIIGEKVAYINKSISEFDFLYDTSSKNAPGYNFKLKEETVYTNYYDKGDIKSLEDIKYFKELKTLRIVLNKIENIEPLINCPKLECLYLDFNELQNITILNSFDNLKNLSFAFNKIEDISPLESNILRNLKILLLSGNNIIQANTLENLENRSNLKYLDLSVNKISEIPNLEDYKSLTDLDLHTNYIVDISNLQKLESIEKLNLNDNKIENISSLETLKTLKTLYLSYNRIENINSIKNLELSELLLHKNRLKEFPNDFKNKKCLINISGNFIQDKISLKDLRSLFSDFPNFNIVAIPDKEYNPTKLAIKINNLHELNNVLYKWNYSNWNETDKEQFELDIPSEEGIHTLFIRATDKFGHTTTNKNEKGETQEIQFSYAVKNE